MKIPKRVVISKDMYQKVKNVSSYNNARLFLLGKNKKGIYIEAMQLQNHHTGCWMIPEVRQVALVRTYLDMVKKELRPGGFAVVPSPSWHPRKDYVVHDLLNVPATYTGQLFIIFDPEPSAFVCTDPRKETVKWIPVTIK